MKCLAGIRTGEALLGALVTAGTLLLHALCRTSTAHLFAQDASVFAERVLLLAQRSAGQAHVLTGFALLGALGTVLLATRRTAFALRGALATNLGAFRVLRVGGQCLSATSDDSHCSNTQTGNQCLTTIQRQCFHNQRIPCSDGDA